MTRYDVCRFNAVAEVNLIVHEMITLALGQDARDEATVLKKVRLVLLYKFGNDGCEPKCSDVRERVLGMWAFGMFVLR